jgi:hypothetical protein
MSGHAFIKERYSSLPWGFLFYLVILVLIFWSSLVFLDERKHHDKA